jgi:hypothetical protein
MFIPLIIALLIIAAFVSAIVNLNSPADGTVINSPDNNDLNNSQPAAVKNYSDSTISFRYPGKFDVKPPQPSDGFIDTVSLITKQRHDEYVSIGVYKSTFQNDSGIRFRTDRPGEYKVIASASGEIVFSKTDQLEYTGFFQRGDKIVSVSFTSAGPQDMSDDFDVVAGSLQLR